jgi:hypothetical protein
MTTTFILTKQPTEAQMSLSTQVKDSVNQAINHLRDALAFAARSEHSMTIGTLSDILMRCESIESMDEIMQKFGSKAKSGNMQMPQDLQDLG